MSSGVDKPGIEPSGEALTMVRRRVFMRRWHAGCMQHTRWLGCQANALLSAGQEVAVEEGPEPETGGRRAGAGQAAPRRPGPWGELSAAP